MKHECREGDSGQKDLKMPGDYVECMRAKGPGIPQTELKVIVFYPQLVPFNAGISQR